MERPLEELPVYTGADAEVAPPIALDTELLNAAPSGARRGTSLSIVVDETGRVDSATPVGRPGSLEEAMFATINASAAKNWRFRPAMKAGQPVRYRRTVWVENR
jgi:hypothetical protein